MPQRIKILALSLLLVSAPAAADLKQIGGAAARSRGNALAVAVNVAVAAAGYIIDEGRKPARRTAEANAEDSSSTETHTKTVTSDAGYNLEYIIAGEAFVSAEAAHKYAIDTLLAKKGYKRTRRTSDGLHYDNLNVYLGYRWGQQSSVGYFTSTVQAAHKDDPTCDKNNICGSIIEFNGSIYYKGTLSEKEVNVSNDYKAKREAAAAEFAKQFETLSDTELEAIISDVKAGAAETTQTSTDASARPTTNTNTKADAKEDAKADEKADEATKDKSKPREEQKPLDLDLPDFCKWARFVCAEPEIEQIEKPEVSKQDIPKNSVRVSFSKSCPADKVIPLSWGSFNTQFVMSYAHICDFASKLAILVQICSTLFALYILAGIKS